MEYSVTELLSRYQKILTAGIGTTTRAIKMDGDRYDMEKILSPTRSKINIMQGHDKPRILRQFQMYQAYKGDIYELLNTLLNDLFDTDEIITRLQAAVDVSVNMSYRLPRYTAMLYQEKPERAATMAEADIMGLWETHEIDNKLKIAQQYEIATGAAVIYYDYISQSLEVIPPHKLLYILDDFGNYVSTAVLKSGVAGDYWLIYYNDGQYFTSDMKFQAASELQQSGIAMIPVFAISDNIVLSPLPAEPLFNAALQIALLQTIKSRSLADGAFKQIAVSEGDEVAKTAPKMEKAVRDMMAKYTIPHGASLTVIPPLYDENIEAAIEKKMSQILGIYGVSASAFWGNSQATSGYARQLELLPVIQINHGQSHKYKRAERMILAWFQKLGYIKPINIKLNIKYKLSSIPQDKTTTIQTDSAERALWRQDLLDGLITPLEYVRHFRPELDEREAAIMAENLNISAQQNPFTFQGE